MTKLANNFVWYDLMTSDPKAAQAFYSKVVGWHAQDAGMPDRSYTILSANEVSIGGLMPIPPAALAGGLTPVWTGYIAVDDVDGFANKVTKAGGRVHHAPEDIPGVGRFAVVADPHGAEFILFKGSSDARPEQPAPGTPGHIGWHELHSGKMEQAFDFYSGLFGWTKAEAIDMGPMGVYQTFATEDLPVGGMVTKTTDIPAPFWLYYFNVDDIETATARVKENGGKIVLEPHQVPGGVWIVQCSDPQGATFALVGPHR